MRRRLSLAVVVLVVAASLPRAQELPEYGPAKGTLIIVGGGNLTGSGISEKFIALAGGPEKKFVIVPTAGGNKNAQGERIAYDEPRIIAPWLRLGLKHVRVLHTHDPKVADTGRSRASCATRTPSGSTAAASGTSSIPTRTRWPTGSSTRPSSAAASSAAAPPVRRRIFQSFRARWVGVASIDIDTRYATIRTRDGRKRRLNLGDLEGTDEVRAALEDARQRLEP